MIRRVSGFQFAVVIATLTMSFSTIHAVEVSGTITTRTWTAANSPYRVTGTITVPAGNTLTIQAGIDVLFDADVPFVVNGILHALGTSSAKIEFRAGVATEWGGIRLESGTASANSRLDYVFISDGNADSCNDETSDYNGFEGGGVFVSGSDNNVLFNNCNIFENRANEVGGGLRNCSTVTLNDCIISGNSGYLGGGIFNTGTATLNRCVIDGNVSTGGGGIYNSSFYSINQTATATLTNCTISRNNALESGGGICNDYWSTATLTNCTVSGNSASQGAGINNESFGDITLLDCTVYGNIAKELYESPYDGGGICNVNGTATLTNCIIRGNSAVSGGGICNISATTTLTNCTISDNKTVASSTSSPLL